MASDGRSDKRRPDMARRLWWALGALGLLAGAAARGVAIATDAPAAAAATTERAEPRVAAPETEPDARRSDDEAADSTREAPSEESPIGREAAQPKPLITVDSHGADAAYPLAAWARVGVNSGFLDGARVDGVALAEFETALAPDAVIDVFGWAGVRDIGVRLPYVVLSACERVFASVPVEGARPDVADAVHPNLGESGWRARVLAAHVPRCDDVRIRAWGVTPLGPGLLPLSGAARISVPVPDSAAAAERASAPPLLTPERVPEVPLREITITADLVNIRRCASIDCEILSQMEGGTYTVYILQNGAEWSLLSFENGTGWLANRLFEADPAKS